MFIPQRSLLFRPDCTAGIGGRSSRRLFLPIIFRNENVRVRAVLLFFVPLTGNTAVSIIFKC